jgi:hypothetical protein
MDHTSGVHFDMAPDGVPFISFWLEKLLGYFWQPLGAVRFLPRCIIEFNIIAAPMLLVHMIYISNKFASCAVDLIVRVLWGPNTWTPHVA